MAKYKSQATTKYYGIGGTDVDYVTCSASFNYLGYTINQISTT